MPELPAPLAERCLTTLGDSPVTLDSLPEPEGPVVYWMRSAIRAEENPALDVACHLAAGSGRGLLVYQGLSERYPFAADRHHRFIIEGAADVQQALARAGIEYVFHLQRPGCDGPSLLQLVAQAGLLVTELFPAQPIAGWTRRLQARLSIPVVQVDAACLAPMTRIPASATDRAFRFRKAAADWHARLTAAPWPIAVPTPAPASLTPPFEPIALAAADIDALVADCRIDHGVAPVPGMRGGSRAGMARWAAFRADGLDRYARDRNDPLRDGVSRLSPWLHYGMVSPFRIAREAAAAAAAGSDGAGKFLDELLVWRELAWAFCFHQPAHDRLAALPAWARETLTAHAEDVRVGAPGPDRLLRGRTGDALWDAAQRSLLAHGELHNNVRMTWGKMIPGWTDGPDAALERLIELNHRFAYDGRDPASYGGLLWCLGGFDRPFPPARPVLGTVRPRDTATHARRLDVPAYAGRTGANRYRIGDQPLRVAVLGAGIAGLSAARTLVDHNVEVTLFDKGRRPGGRLATRESRSSPELFDHGAPAFTASDPRAGEWLARWAASGLVEPWQPRLRGGDDSRWRAHLAALDPWPPTVDDPVVWRASSTMAQLPEALAAGLDLRPDTRIVALEGEPGDWWLRSERGERSGPWHWLVVTLPPPQALALLPTGELAQRLEALAPVPVWTLMADVDGDPDWDVAVPPTGPLRLAVRQRDRRLWVAHAEAGFSRGRLEDAPEQVAATLADALAELSGGAVGQARAHRWRYGLPAATGSASPGWIIDHAHCIGQAGDACLPGVAGAFLSGRWLAGALLGQVVTATGAPD